MAKASGTKKSASSSKSKKPAKSKAPAPKSKKPAAKSAAKAPAKKHAASSKAPAAKTPASKPVAPAAPASGAGAVDPKKVPPKGITIVAQKPIRKAKPKPKAVLPIAEPLLKPGQKWKPLIPSGPKAPPVSTGLEALAAASADAAKNKSPRLGKRELDKYRAILLRKRAELVGDISNMEEEALRQNSGSLSSLPQHMAEQGSDTFEQSLSLDLAQVDRNLLREIDAALKRIDDGTFGICELTGKQIASERLDELPWARYSIEAARELERRPYLLQGAASAAASSASAGDSGGDD